MKGLVPFREGSKAKDRFLLRIKTRIGNNCKPWIEKSFTPLPMGRNSGKLHKLEFFLRELVED